MSSAIQQDIVLEHFRFMEYVYCKVIIYTKRHAMTILYMRLRAMTIKQCRKVGTFASQFYKVYSMVEISSSQFYYGYIYKY